MNTATQKIWKAVGSLEKADTQAAALCHSIINMMINHGVVTKEEFTRQIEKSVTQVVSVHKKIAKAMQNQNSAVGAGTKLNTMQ